MFSSTLYIFVAGSSIVHASLVIDGAETKKILLLIFRKIKNYRGQGKIFTSLGNLEKHNSVLQGSLVSLGSHPNRSRALLCFIVTEISAWLSLLSFDRTNIGNQVNQLLELNYQILEWIQWRRREFRLSMLFFLSDIFAYNSFVLLTAVFVHLPSFMV